MWLSVDEKMREKIKISKMSALIEIRAHFLLDWNTLEIKILLERVVELLATKHQCFLKFAGRRVVNLQFYFRGH